MKRLGVIGSMVWDEIHGRDIHSMPVEEWGGIAYALSALDASLPDDWEIVPLIKVGSDLAPQAADFLASLQHRHPDARFITVPTMTQRVTLRYDAPERRSEQMRGGVPPWSWEELGPMVHGLDAIYVNFISGAELPLTTASLLRQAFRGPLYADLHSLALDTTTDGFRVLQAVPDAPAWCAVFDIVQCNSDEFAQLGPDAPTVAAEALRAGVSLLVVTLGPRGVAYVARQGFSSLADLSTPHRESLAIQTELIAPPEVEVLDPTGCGDVFGATCCARLLAGDSLPVALAAANQAAARNATFRGASHLADLLRGRLVLA